MNSWISWHIVSRKGNTYVMKVTINKNHPGYWLFLYDSIRKIGFGPITSAFYASKFFLSL